jgi:hypothetical protein
MPTRLLICLALLATTVAVHTIGLATVLRWILRSPALADTRFWPGTWLVIRVVWSLIAIHVLAIGIWAAFYWWQGCMPDAESALYFSGVTYTTIGYGDVLLPIGWRFLGPVEGLAGILMCGLSTGFFFAMLTRMRAPNAQRLQP